MRKTITPAERREIEALWGVWKDETARGLMIAHMKGWDAGLAEIVGHDRKAGAALDRIGDIRDGIG